MPKVDFAKLFRSFSELRVGVIGDVMLDSYIWGNVDRISPEAPVPVVTLKKQEQRIGGAGNVALNLQSLGAKSFIISVIGDDPEGERLNSLFLDQQINTTYCIKSSNRI